MPHLIFWLIVDNIYYWCLSCSYSYLSLSKAEGYIYLLKMLIFRWNTWKSLWVCRRLGYLCDRLQCCHLNFGDIFCYLYATEISTNYCYYYYSSLTAFNFCLTALLYLELLGWNRLPVGEALQIIGARVLGWMCFLLPTLQMS